MNEQDKIKLQSDLDQCIGTEHYYPHFSKQLKYTDGVQLLAERAGAYWLIDLIASYKRKEPFQVWTLKCKDGKGVVTMIEDTGKPILVKQKLDYTNFPLDEITLWLIDGVLILTSEY